MMRFITIKLTHQKDIAFVGRLLGEWERYEGTLPTYKLYTTRANRIILLCSRSGKSGDTVVSAQTFSSMDTLLESDMALYRGVKEILSSIGVDHVEHIE